MVKGLYNLTSGMLTQRRNLDVISSNMANVSTAGFKADQLSSSTFRNELMGRTGNTDKANAKELAEVSMARIPRETITDFTQGAFQQTDRKLDLAVSGDGFFQVRNNGGVRYTRSGSFNLNNQGYICTQDGSLLLGKKGPIQVFHPQAEELTKDGDSVQEFNAENIRVDANGGVYDKDGNFIDQIQLVIVSDPTQLVKEGEFFTGGGEVRYANGTVLQGCLEASNVDALKEMVSMIESERHLQSAAQVLKIYDQMLGKATTEIGKIN
nr:flagellar hook-basal body protein [uncultured Anaerotignum sp.]